MSDEGREQFDTGSVRDSSKGKGKYCLISPFALDRLAKHYERGGEQYGWRNWEKGQPISRVMDSALRHANQFMMGLDDYDHLAALAWNAFAAMHIQEMISRGVLPSSLDDMPEYRVQNGIPRASSVVIATNDNVNRNPWHPYDNRADFKDCFRRQGHTEVEIETMARAREATA